jgi:hypothetical protein
MKPEECVLGLVLAAFAFGQIIYLGIEVGGVMRRKFDAKYRDKCRKDFYSD